MNDQRVDEYIARTIKEGDKGSKLLAVKCALTLKRPYVDIISSGMNGIAVLRPNLDCLIAVHSTGGDPTIGDLRGYTRSMVDRLVEDSHRIGAEPLGFGDIVDASSMDINMVATIGDELRVAADYYKLPVLNGELADLGSRVCGQANVSGTMISALSRNSSFTKLVPGIFEHEGITYAVFDSEGKAVFINCDGIGTKTEFYERAMKNNESLLRGTGWARDDYIDHLPCGVEDFAAMNLDDTGKLGAIAQVLSGVIETKGNLPVKIIKERLRKVTESFGVLGILQHEEMGNRLRGYNDGAFSYNISGAAVSTIDEERLKNLPHPQVGDSLVAIRGVANPRSNGITAKRKVMNELFGNAWHEERAGQLFLNYLATPSTILYPAFTKLLQEGIATSVFHNSGGAYNGKLARPLAKHGLFVDLGNRLFQPDWREVTLAAYSLSVRDSYEKWPMGTDGFVSTSNPEAAICVLHRFGFNSRVVGKLEAAIGDKTGVTLTAFNNQEVYFSGRD